MIRVNLLPHRQIKRAQRQRQMVVLAAASAAVGALVWAVVHTMLASEIETQNERNKLLTDEIAKLDKQIDEIKRVKEETAALLSRKQVVEGLQANRSEAVRMLDQLIRVMPEGTYLRTVKQTGTLVNLTGLAQSNARVSSLMRNLEDSKVFETPDLVEIHATTVGSVRASEFALNARLAQAKPEGKTGPAKGDAKTGAPKGDAKNAPTKAEAKPGPTLAKSKDKHT